MNIDEIDLNLLRVFDAVITDGSITRAAERLGLTQPAVSNALGRLRAITHDRLFVRTTRGVAPTPYAEDIRAPIHEALAAMRSALSEAGRFDPATATRRFRIYLTDLGEAYFLPRLLAHLAQAAPGVHLETLPMPEREHREALATGGVDLAVGNLPDLGAGFYQQRLFRGYYVCLVRADHPAIGETLDRETFARLNHAVVAPAGTGHGAIEAALVANGLAERITLRVQNFLVLPAIAAQSDLVAMVPHLVGEQMQQGANIRLLPSPIGIPAFDIRQCWHERLQDDAGHRWLRRALAGLFGET